MTPDILRLRRIRWAVRGVLILGLVASVAANVAHAQPTVAGRLIAGWAPLALLLTIELVVRVPIHRRWVAVVRLVATAGIAFIAAWVSYWHMKGVAERYGETGLSALLLPFSVDGLVVVASICLVEISGRLRAVEGTGVVPPVVPVVSQPVSAPDSGSEPVPEGLAAMSARDAARHGWRESGESEKAAVVRWLSEQGRTDDSARKAVYAVAREFQTEPGRRLVAVSGDGR